MTALSDVDLVARVRRVVVAWDGDEYMLGRPDLALYVVVPPPGGILVEALQEGQPLPVATARAGAVDERRIAEFVDKRAGRYDHGWTGDDPC
jgi:hypothetical protein